MKVKKGRPINGWINLNKPLGLTSADAVARVKHLLKPQKIGHAGTLDPLATGVLPLALGEGTKCVNLLMDAKKTYEFTVTFGERRTTDDAEGEVAATSDHMPDEVAIRAILPRFTGEISQLPPIYSALKVAGERAYALARAGQEVVLTPRPVTIHSLEWVSAEEVASKASSPCGRRLEEGTRDLRMHLPLAQEEQTLDRSKALRRNQTETEKALWNRLRAGRLNGLKFHRQQPMEQYIVDFICFDHRLIIELDGGQHASAEGYDAKRTAYLESQGFRVLRFWNHEISENLDGVLTVISQYLVRPLSQPSPAGVEGLRTVHFRAIVSKGTYIRSLGRDIAQALGTEGYISRLHRSAVGPFTDAHAISLDFLAESVHNAPPPEGFAPWLTPLEAALDDIPALALNGGQLAQLRHGQRVTLTDPQADMPQIAVMENGKLFGLARIEGNQVIPVRLLNIGV